MHHFYRISPLQLNNSNNPMTNKPAVTYTDQRIDQIKKKYDTPKKQYEHDKQNATTYKSIKHCQTEARDKKDSLQLKNQYSSIGACLRERKNVQVSRFGLAQGQGVKASTFSNAQDLHIKPTISSKLHINQTDQHFYKLKTEQSAESIMFLRNKDSYTKINRREYFDPRIESIDKINSKIKRILDCIDDCEKEEVRHSGLRKSREDRGRHIKNGIMGISINSSIEPQNQLQQTTIIEKQTITYKNNEDRQANSNANHSEMFKIPSLAQMRASHSNNQFSQYLNSYKNQLKQRENQSLVKPNAKKQKSIPKLANYFDQLKKSYKKDSEQEDNVTPKTDQINEQINKFQQKILELQEQKRKLNIRFKPFYYQPSPMKKSNVINSKDLAHKYDSSLKKPKTQVAVKQQYEFSQQNQNKIETYHQNQQQNYEKSYSLPKEEDSQQKTYDNYELRKKIEQRMEQRRKKIELLHHESKEKDIKETKNLIHTLCQQVKLDSDLRNAKNWFSQSKNHQRVTILYELLKAKGIHLSKIQIEEQFSELHQDESDPFFSFREQKYTIESMVDYYLKCISHWNYKVSHKWNKLKLHEQNFESNFFNTNDILIEDIVRLLNTQTGSFYRNRDLYLIYVRIKKELNKGESQSISIKDLLDIFS